MKIEKILVPFDDSEHSVNAANYALYLAKLVGAHVTILNCYGWSSYISEVPVSLMNEFEVTRKKEAEAIVKKAGILFEGQGVEYSLETIYGLPGSVLARQAESRKYDLIIMGSHGHSDITGLFLGSVTHKVLNTIYCPVLIVP